MTFTTGFFTHQGNWVRFLEAGKGPTIIFLQGGGVRASTYAPLLKELAKNYRVIAPDLPGFGGSSTPDNIWGLIDYADFF